jgi:Flp pilus assembly protein TadG
VARFFAARVMREDSGSQIVEFAVTLPLIAFFLIGIFDFSQAYSVKQRVLNAAREGARVGSNQPTQDLSILPSPPSVDALVQSVGRSLSNAGLNDCGLASNPGAWVVTIPGTLAWTYTASGCALNPTVTVERGVVTQVAMAAPYPGGNMSVENTRVTVTYPYTWSFGKIVTVAAPGSSFAGPTTLQGVATMQNLN